MVEVTRLNGSKLWVNALHIELVEETPDTYITLYNGKKVIVREPASEVIRQVTAYLQTIGALAGTMKLHTTEEQS
ncbi:flagellar FlbD family protein [Paenibacillus sp. 1001270B_150601_E10]|uniref:flagellar FlbD family protein n=1 Tax=Paenibacillus sp. 1001270B_150601_E10 TaxID=2787079 RepID=UPI0018A0C45F|nr:flagellar FlbD family protein [Paenibacillus sp. 1001270B_150601_E10]